LTNAMAGVPCRTHTKILIMTLQAWRQTHELTQRQTITPRIDRARCPNR
jgi:hypothetical protein